MKRPDKWYIDKIGVRDVNIPFFYVIQIALLVMCVGSVVGGAYIAAGVFLIYIQLVSFLLMYVVKDYE